MSIRNDVTPPGREEQVRALKEKPGIDNPYAVAWASYEKGDAAYDGAKCDNCGQTVPVDDGCYDAHVMPVKTDAAVDPNGDGDVHKMCDGSGAECREDVVEQRGGKWVLLAKSTGKVLGTHATKAEAEEQERAVQASKRAEDEFDPEQPRAENGQWGEGGRVRRFERIDFASPALPAARTTADGFLQVFGRVARTGIQEYRDAQGGIRRELRLPEEVKKSLPSFPLQPLTNTHPADMVSPTNAQQLVKGAVGDAELGADGWVVAPMTIYSADAIAAARGGRVQLSVGYTCRVDHEAGEWRGQRYDAVQRDIVVNHVALVDMARAGAEARLRLDAGDAEASVACDTADTATSTHQERHTMAKLKIGALEFEVSDPNCQAAHNDAISVKDREIAAERLRADNADKLVVEKQKTIDALQARVDARADEDRAPIRFDGQEIAAADAQDPAKFDAFVQPIVEARAAARASLLVEARKHLGTNAVLDAHQGKDGKLVAAKTDGEIRRMVVAKLKPAIKLDGKSDEYVSALYDDAVAAAAKATPTAAEVARAIGSGIVPVQPQLAGERADNVVKLDAETAYKRQNQSILRMNARHPDNAKKGA